MFVFDDANVRKPEPCLKFSSIKSKASQKQSGHKQMNKVVRSVLTLLLSFQCRIFSLKPYGTNASISAITLFFTNKHKFSKRTIAQLVNANFV